MIIFTLKLFSGSVLEPGVPNGASSMLLLISVPEIYTSIETQYKVKSIKISEMNQTMILFI